MVVLASDVTHDAAGAEWKQRDYVSQRPSLSPPVLSLGSAAEWTGSNTPRSTANAQSTNLLTQVWLTLNSPLMEQVPSDYSGQPCLLTSDLEQ
jgi:hypothetical protein